jgi:fatty-acyl-CoA synthase
MARTIGDAFDRACALHADRDAVVSRHQGVRLTYRELGEEVGRAARALMAIGVEKGDRVGIWSPNTVEWIVVQYATAKIGAILVNVNPAYRTHELEYALRHSGVSTLITAPRFRSADYLSMIAEVRPGLPELRDVIVLGAADPGRDRSWSDVLAGADQVSDEALRRRAADLDFDEPINIQYTSGTTGFPKGATLSHHNILNNGFFVGERLRLTSDDRVCLPVPFYHCFGMVLGNLACLTHGSAVVIPAEAFNAGETLAAIDAERCTAVYGVPTMFIAMLEHPEFGTFDLTSLRTGIMAGSPCPVEVMRQAIDRMHLDEVTICYGMTETSPVSFQSHVTDDIERRVSTVGSIHPWVESKLVDPATGKTVPRGKTGELCSRGYLVMLGYWNDPAATSAAIDQARWMHTGDLAVMRDDGYVNIVGRLKDMVIRGGENVYPREIEEFLYGHPKIADVQVIGVPDARYGEELCAWIKLKRDETATEDEIRDFCRGRIATFKIPRYIRFTEEFPVTITGKVQKYRMREVSTAELGLEDAAAVVTA